MTSPMQVQAANYGGFGSTYSEVINPKDSVLNEETAGSEDVKSGLASLSEFKSTIKTIKEDLVSCHENRKSLPSWFGFVIIIIRRSNLINISTFFRRPHVGKGSPDWAFSPLKEGTCSREN
jgi:hypothetical protein